MLLKNIITTEGSLLNFSTKKQSISFLKNDPYSNYLWKSFKKTSALNKTKKLEIYKTRFLKKSLSNSNIIKVTK